MPIHEDHMNLKTICRLFQWLVLSVFEIDSISQIAAALQGLVQEVEGPQTLPPIILAVWRLAMILAGQDCRRGVDHDFSECH